MERVEDPKVTEWIRRERGRTFLLPRSFRAYCKIFHPIYEDLSVLDRTRTWDEEAKQRLLDMARPVPPDLVRGMIVARGSAGEDFPRARIQWRDLAERYGIPFDPKMDVTAFDAVFGASWPRYLVGPAEGTLESEAVSEVVGVLERFTGKQLCYFFYEPLPVDPAIYRGGLDEVLAIAEATQRLPTAIPGSPTYWWPADRSWCVCTNRDLTYTFVGGSEALIAAFVSETSLECVGVDLLTWPAYQDISG